MRGLGERDPLGEEWALSLLLVKRGLRGLDELASRPPSEVFCGSSSGGTCSMYNRFLRHSGSVVSKQACAFARSSYIKAGILIATTYHSFPLVCFRLFRSEYLWISFLLLVDLFRLAVSADSLPNPTACRNDISLKIH